MDRGQALLTWFSYDPHGNQYWMIGVGELDEDRRVQFGLHATRGGRFGDAFDANEVELIEWGTLTLDLDCLDGTMAYESVLPEFGSAVHDLERLTVLAGLDCPFFMPEVGALEHARWDKRFTIAGIHSSLPVQLNNDNINLPSVHDLLALPNGDVLAAGTFNWLGQTQVPPLIQGSGAGDWQAFAPAIDLATLAATALAQDGSHPLVMAVSDPGRIMLVHDEALETIGQFEGIVRRLAWHDGQLWAAGPFEMTDGGPAMLAVWDGTNWQAAPGGQPDGPALALESSAEGLYVGGQFGQIGGMDAESIARWDGQTWTAYDLQAQQGFGEPANVYAIASTPDGLFAAGAIVGAVRWDGSQWQPLGNGLGGANGSPVVSDIHLFQGQLYAIGCFAHANGSADDPDAVPAAGIARWTGEIWEAVDDGSIPISSPYPLTSTFLPCFHPLKLDRPWSMRMQRLASDGDYLYVGGSLVGLGGQPSQGLIAYDGNQFVPVGHTQRGVSGIVDQLLHGPDNEVYASGVTHFGTTQSASGLFRLDSTHGWLDAGLPPLPDESNCWRRLLTLDHDERILLGCTAGHSQDEWRPRVFRLDDLHDWTEIEIGEIDVSLRRLNVIVTDPQGTIWIAGEAWDDENFLEKGFVARLTDDGFEIFEDSFNGMVLQLAFAPDSGENDQLKFIARGWFNSIGDQEATRLAYWNDGSWQSMGTLIGARSISYGAQHILAGTLDGGGYSLARWNGEDWAEMATPENGFPDFGDEQAVFTGIHQLGERIILVGEVPGFTPESGHVFIHEPGNFTVLSGGLAGRPPTAVLVTPEAILFGGPIIEADPYGHPVSTLGIGRLTWD
ncbi:MAG: hypothetical protein EA370_14955 [Wenzhouxiangella sp.]|nr:MAG: hypothetical protein EA370_14955 [Wenzhouxiangella sp.]